jgi:hypothetical protein
VSQIVVGVPLEASLEPAQARLHPLVSDFALGEDILDLADQGAQVILKVEETQDQNSRKENGQTDWPSLLALADVAIHPVEHPEEDGDIHGRLGDMRHIEEIAIRRGGGESAQDAREDFPPHVRATGEMPAEPDHPDQKPEAGEHAERSELRPQVEILVVGMLDLHTGVPIDEPRSIRDECQGEITHPDPGPDVIPDQPERSLPEGPTQLKAI